jgi:hypothetical protein
MSLLTASGSPAIHKNLLVLTDAPSSAGPSLECDNVAFSFH